MSVQYYKEICKHNAHYYNYKLLYKTMDKIMGKANFYSLHIFEIAELILTKLEI